MKDSSDGLGIHLTRESDLRGAIPGQHAANTPLGEDSPRSGVLGDAASQKNPLLYLAGVGAGWLGRKGLAKAWSSVVKPLAEEIGHLPVIKAARSIWTEYNPSKLWQRAKNAVFAQHPLGEKAADAAFDPARASKLADKASSDSLAHLAASVGRTPGPSPSTIPSIEEAAGHDFAPGAARQAGLKVAEEGLMKEGEETTGKVLGKSLLKKVPILGVAAGAAFAWSRARRGDWMGAAGEMASGVASCFPGIGTGVSVAIDAGLAGRDIYYAEHHPVAAPTLYHAVAGAGALRLIASNEGQASFRRATVGPSRLRNLNRPSIDPDQLVAKQPVADLVHGQVRVLG